jgi:hypothetical protein
VKIGFDVRIVVILPLNLLFLELGIVPNVERELAYQKIVPVSQKEGTVLLL